MEKKDDKWWQDSDWKPPTDRTTRSAGTRASPRHPDKRVSPRKLRLSAGSTDESTVKPDATFDKISENNSPVVKRKNKKIDTTSEFELSASEDEDLQSNIIADPPIDDHMEQSTRTIERGNQSPANERSANGTYDVFNTDTESEFSGIAPTRPPPPKKTEGKIPFDKSEAKLKKSFGIQFDAENMTLEKSRKSFGVQYEVENQTRYTSAKSSVRSKKTTRKLAPDSHSPLSDNSRNVSSSFQLSEDDDEEAMITLTLPQPSPKKPIETGRTKLMTKRTDKKTSERTKEVTTEHTLEFGKTRTIIKNESTNVLDDKTKVVGKITSEDSVLPSSKLIKDQKHKMKNKSKVRKVHFSQKNHNFILEKEMSSSPRRRNN